MITVDWATRIITVPQSFLTFVGGVSYQLDTEAFKVAINDIEDNEQGMVHPPILNHATSVLLDGIEYARVLEIINGYTITFEETGTPYKVFLIGSNNNILTVTNLGTVQVAPANSAGLINLNELQFGVYQNAVWIDQTFGAAGIGYPKGTPLDPVNNIPDAITIAQARGFQEIRVIGNLTLDTGDNVENYRLVGQNAARTQLVINAGAETLGCEIQEAYVTGNLDGGTILRQCVIDSLNYINGFVFQCMINPGTISLGGTTPAHFLSCYSGVPGLGTPIIDMNGVTDDQDTPLAIRGYNGGIELRDKTGAGSVSIDLSSGQVKIANTCTNGTVVIRGDGEVTDPATGQHLHTGIHNGNLQLVNQTVAGAHVHDIWQRLALDPMAPITNNNDGSYTVGNIIVDAAPSGSSIIQTRRP